MALAAASVACLLLLGILLPIGLVLFIGEWVFGSIGWGLLHGTLTLIAVALTALFVAVRVRGLRWDLAIAVMIGIVLAILFALALPNALWRTVGDSVGLGDPAWRPLVSGVVILGILGALVGLVLGATSDRGSAAGGLAVGLVAGSLAGAFSAISFEARAGVAAGVAVGLAAWPALMGARTARHGIDFEDLKSRFWPQATIDTTMETIEWAKARNPLGPRS